MTLSLEQIELYLNRVGLPDSTKSLLFEGTAGRYALQSITTLQRCHMAAIPFENLDLHYSVHKTPPQDTENVFRRVVTQNRGGTCVQVNLLFTQLLQSLGFDAYCSAGRINAAASIADVSNVKSSKVAFGPWAHVHTLVTIQGQKYLVETSFNQHGSPSPAALIHNQIVTDVWKRQRRMIRSQAAIGGWSKPDQPWWRMQIRNNEEDEWMDVYCFNETEWTPLDFELLAAGLNMLGVGWFRTLIVCFRLLVENDTAVGYLLVWADELRRCYKGKTEVIQKFYSESERTTVLAKEFGIMLSMEERKAIRGTPTELVEDPFNYYG